MKNVFFYFMLKALYVLEIFTFLSWFLGYIEKRLDKKTMVNYKIYNVRGWTTNNNTHIVQYLKKWRQPDNKVWSINRIWHEKYFFCEKLYTYGEASPRRFYKKIKIEMSEIL